MSLHFIKKLLLILALIYSFQVKANPKIDSLKTLMQSSNNTNKKLQIELYKEYAIEDFDTYIKEFEKLKPIDNKDLLDFYYKQAYLINSYFNNQNGLWYINELLDYFEHSNDIEKQLKLLCKLGSNLNYTSTYDSCIANYHKIEQLFNKYPEFKKNDIYGYYYSIKGVFLCMHENNTDGLAHFLKADSIYSAQNNLSGLTSTAEYIANVYVIINDFESAITEYNKAMQYAKKNKNHSRLTTIYDNLALAYKENNQIDSALKSLELARECIAITKDSSDLISNYILTYETEYKYNKNFNSSIKWLLDAEKISKNVSNNYIKLQIKKSLANAYINNKQYETGIEYAEKLLKEANLFQIGKFRKQAYFEIWRANDSLSNTDEAYLACQWYYWLKDSIDKSKFSQQVLSLKNDYDSKQKKLEISNLKAQAELAAEREENKDKTNKALLFGIIISLLLLIVISYFAYNLKKTKAIISENNKLLKESDHQKATLLKELHHRVKNNLQIVSSLLSWQGDSVKDKSAQIAFREGQNRVDAMAMIHRHLYKTDEFSSININSYLERLTRSIAFSYGYDKNNFKLYTDITNDPIDVDIAIPIGLIVNELVSNTFKHAFKNIDVAEIHISLTTENSKLYLNIKDNGIGLPNDFKVSDTASFGLELVQTLVTQLKGKISIENNNGAIFKIELNTTDKQAA